MAGTVNRRELLKAAVGTGVAVGVGLVAGVAWPVGALRTEERCSVTTESSIRTRDYVWVLVSDTVITTPDGKVFRSLGFESRPRY